MLAPARRSPSAIERAMARAEAFGEERRRIGPPAIAELTTRAAFDPIVQVSQHYERSRAFQSAYIKHLTEALERTEEELKRAEEEHMNSSSGTDILPSRSALLRRLVTILVFGKRAA